MAELDWTNRKFIGHGDSRVNLRPGHVPFFDESVQYPQAEAFGVGFAQGGQIRSSIKPVRPRDAIDHDR